MTLKNVRPSRRTLLKLASATLALPWMEAFDARASTVVNAPRRMAVLFMANGINAKHWWAKGQGADMILGKTLEPLGGLRSKLNLVDGLFNKESVNKGIHPVQTGNLLSGASLQKGALLRGGVSIDQMLARAIGEETAHPSLVLGCEQPTTGYHESNYSLAYSSHLSWQTETTPVPLEVYPAQLFDSLFENRSGRRDQSILEGAASQSAALLKKVGRSDQHKLDEYLTSVREVEKRLQRRSSMPTAAGPMTATGEKMNRPADGIPTDIAEHMRLMCDLLALAFQSDRTRLATLILCRDLSGMTYPFMGIRKAHHPMSHEDHSDDYEKICRFYVGHLAHLATRLDSMKEGDRTVLDNSCLLFTSNMWSGTKHDSNRLPLVTLGSLGGTIPTGRTLNYLQHGDEKRKMCSLYLALADRILPEPARLPQFGDATERLTDF
ncbi:MAG: DUF1552 domain-containing protein [Deltaproteobacteria bacterium]|nr:DUF1552 domain-containing protein [Deltaproteobacteria bacterium]